MVALDLDGKFSLFYIIVMEFANTYALCTGTTLNSDHQLSQKTIDTLRRLSSSGVLICIATGRSITGIERYVEELNLSQPIVPCVGMVLYLSHSSSSSLLFPIRLNNPYVRKFK